MKKKILYISPIFIYPKIMASQDRILNMAIYLSKVHNVDFVIPYVNEEIKQGSLQLLESFKGNVIFIKYPNSNKTVKIFYTLKRNFEKFVFNKIIESYYSMSFPVKMQLIKIINKKKYDIIQIEYWYQGKIFNYLKYKTLKVIDTHNVLFGKRELEYRELGKRSGWTKRQLAAYKKNELYSYRLSDFLISISKQDLTFFQHKFPDKRHLLIYTGQQTKDFANYKSKKENDNTILFYGSLGGKQNTEAFWRLFHNIYPLVKKEIAHAKLLVVGANPPKEINALEDGENIFVTGYVDDLMQELSKAKLMILPLNIAGGFRSRVVEVMALGIPIIGTTNAMDNTGIENGKQGFIIDSNKKMAEKAVELLTDDELRKKIGKNAQEYALNTFSLENTYGKLAEYYSNLVI